MEKTKKKNNLTSLMNHLGWGSGFHLPIANKENEALIKQVKNHS